MGPEHEQRDASRATGDRWRPARALLAAALILFGVVGLSYAWRSVDRGRDDAPRVLRNDAQSFATILRTGELTSVDAPFRYRPLTPLLASLVPAPPAALRDFPRPMSGDELLAYRFALVNAVGLALAAWFFLLLLGELGFGPWECLAGSLLLLVSYYPVSLGTAPLAEAWAWASLAAGLWALLAGRWWLLGAAFALGLFNKESALLVPLAAALLPWSRNDRVRLAVCFVPTLAIYAGFRFALAPDGTLGASVGWHVAYLERLFTSSDWIEFPRSLLASFGALWLPAAVGWRCARPGSPLARWRLLIPLVLVAPFVFVKGMGRVWFFAFPFVLPLALLGIRSWVERWRLPAP